ncbi:DUF4405 domain-containing protein [Dysgonomonas sp. 520]|uniref:DUF4405 domain-containing protein n=1 Tax=Dysgonomonas sp. 520 TaxID=2302931 RepID=UPI0013D68691|nr:DUF4405 domain-containing protein [Dysgonomonas sp. 520]NDW10124.1 hypothetical protein [Dysgonomonas sp. 520]
MANKFSLTKGKSIFIIDLILIPICILLVYSGLKLHKAGHGIDHDIWEYWANYHVVVSIVSLILVWWHVKAHWNWYKGLMQKGLKGKSKTTVFISVLFFILTMTGILLIFFIDGANSSIGLWHYKLGLITTFLIVIHIVKRFPMMVKGLKLKKKSRNSNAIM